MMDFEKLKATFEFVSKSIFKGQEPMQELNALRQFLKQLAHEHAAVFIEVTKTGESQMIKGNEEAIEVSP